MHALSRIFSRSTRRPWMLLAALGLCAPWAAGCEQAPQQPDSGYVEPPRPDSDWVVHNDLLDLVEEAKRKDAEAILRRMEKYFLTEEEMLALFGPEAGPAAWTGYAEEIIPKLRAEAVPFIIERVAEGYTEVFVGMAGPSYPARTTRGDHRILESFVQKRPIYSAWLRKPGESLGLRLNGFLYLDGRWRTLLKTYEYLPERPAAGAEAAGEGAAAEEAPRAPGAEAPQQAPAEGAAE